MLRYYPVSWYLYLQIFSSFSWRTVWHQDCSFFQYIQGTYDFLCTYWSKIRLHSSTLKLQKLMIVKCFNVFILSHYPLKFTLYQANFSYFDKGYQIVLCPKTCTVLLHQKLQWLLFRWPILCIYSEMLCCS